MILQRGQISTPAAVGWIIIAILAPANLPGADTNPPPPFSTNALVRELGSGEFQIGEVRLHKPTRTIRLPASVNLREGNIEYILVTATGKTHESLLRTSVEPIHVQLAFLLLGAKGSDTNALPENPAATLPGQLVAISLLWTNGTTTNVLAPESFVLDRKAGAPAKTGSWTYTGSRLREDGFAAQLDGSIISLITDADALVNNPRPGREDDDNWIVRTNGLPPLGTPVQVQLQLVR